MSQEQWTAVDAYFDGLFIGEDPIQEAVLADSDAAGLPKINVAPNQGKLLMLLAQIQGAKAILEVGTLGGYSTIWLGRALPADGHLVTLEYDQKHAEVARKNIERAGMTDKVEVRVGLAVDHLAGLVDEGHDPFDMIFLDADKVNYPNYLTWSLRLSRPGTLIVADNVVRDGEVVNAGSDDENVIGVRQFSQMLAEEPRVDGIALQTVGSKGYDGFALIRVR
ncbi:MAG: O-methyltransferase [Chloroflexota bacterium]